MSSIKKVTDILILIFVAYFIVRMCPSIENVSLLKSENLLAFNFAVLGLGITLIIFLRDIHKDYIDKLDQDPNIYILLGAVISSINFNIKRMLFTVLAIIVIHISQNSTIILIRFDSQKGLDIFNTTYKISLALYLFASIFDIIISTLRLYEAELRHE